MQEHNTGTHTLVNAGLDQFQILLWMVRTPNYPVGPTHSTLPDGPIKSESSPPLMSTQRLLCYSLQTSPALPFTWAGSPQMDFKCIQYRILLMFFPLEAMKETYLYFTGLHWMLLRKYSPSSLSMGGISSLSPQFWLVKRLGFEAKGLSQNGGNWGLRCICSVGLALQNLLSSPWERDLP